MSAFTNFSSFGLAESAWYARKKLLEALPNAPSQLRVVSPPSVGLEKKGHVSAFRPMGETALWPMPKAAVQSAI